ncbi:kinase-like protein [Byssothecium circinans]|uniref:Kinase-like protein n=1 Tax=Byssothecium circinans TaxID=147558 RepID=A0A6A5TVD6_9PLEO|nr:kinase-like protein [Byssothecium circinans]
MKHPTNKAQEFTSEDDIFSYKAQRWLWNETEQFQRRHLRFDLEALIRAVENAAGPGANCVELTKLPEGNFNKTFLVTMIDGRQLIARLPNLNAGRPHYTTASEVATMDYVRDRLEIPVPKVLAYSTQASTNDIGAEYIIMEKCPGIELGRLWDDFSGKQKVDIVRQLATFSARLSKARFPCYGSLYYAKDIPDIRGTEVDDTFSVGPITSRTWFDDKRGEVNVHRGPWTSAEDVLDAIMKREVACLDAFSEFPQDRQQGIFNGPGGFHPSKASKMAVIRDYSRILPLIVPKDEAYTASVLWHNDLHSDNIFVNENNPTQITGIIDWQAVHLSPAFLHVHYPSLIEYDGKILEVFETPKLPSNFADLDPVAQANARNLHTAQSIWGLYQIFIQKEAPDLLRVLRYRDTLPCQIMTLIGSIFDDGEAYIQSLLSQLAEPDVRKTVVKASGQEAVQVPCPLVYSDRELSKQKDELARWEKDIERKAQVIEEVGAYTGWDGAVSPEEYGMVSEELEKAKEKFLDAESNTPEEREQWANVWPFKDKRKSTT